MFSHQLILLFAFFLMATPLWAAPTLQLHPDATPSTARITITPDHMGGEFQLASSTNLIDWTDEGAPIDNRNSLHEKELPASTKQLFVRLKPQAPDLLHMPLRTNLEETFSRGIVTLSGTTKPTYTTGITSLDTALVLDGNTQVEFPVNQTLSALSVSVNMYLKDLKHQAKTMLIDTGDDPGCIKVYLEDNLPTLGSYSLDLQDEDNRYRHRETYVIMQVVGNTGGDGPTSDSFRSIFHRYGEYEESYFETLFNEHIKLHGSINTVNERYALDRNCLWFNLTLSYDPASKEIHLYHNGRLDVSGTFSTAQSPKVETLHVGGDASGNHRFEGRICDVYLSDGVYTLEKAAALADFRPRLWGNRDADHWVSLRTYTVDGTAGSDSNDGLTQPVKTLSKAIELTQAEGRVSSTGSRILIRPGDYREPQMTLNHGGTRYHPLIIEAETPGTVTINGSELWDDDDWQKTSDGQAWYHDWNYTWGAKGYEGQTIEVFHRQEAFYLNDILFRQVTSLADLKAAPGSDPREQHKFYIDEAAQRIYIRTALDPNQGKAESALHTLFKSEANQECNFLVMRGLTFTKSKEVIVIRGFHHLYEDCEIVANSMRAFVLNTTDTVIRRCSFRDNGRYSYAIRRGHHTCEIQDTEVTGNQWRGEYGGYSGNDSSAIAKFMFSTHTYMDRAFIHNNGLRGFWYDANNWNSTIEDSYISHNRQNGAWIEVNANGQSIDRCSFVRNEERNIRIKGEDIRINDSNFLCADNTRALFEQYPSAASHEFVIIPLMYYGKNMRIKNSTFASDTANGYSIELRDFTQETMDSIQSGGNRYYSQAAKPVYSQGASKTFDEWFATIGDTTSVTLTSNPFSDPGNLKAAFTEADAALYESSLVRSIPISLSAPVDATVTITYKINNGSANEGSDFRVLNERTEAAGTLTFHPLETTRMLHVQALKDGVKEGRESFSIELLTATSPTLTAQLGSKKKVTIALLDERPTPPIPTTRNAYALIQAESYDNQLGAVLQSGCNGFTGISKLRGNHWVKYSKVDFGNTPPKKISLHLAVADYSAKGIRLSIGTDQPETTIADLTTTATGTGHLFAYEIQSFDLNTTITGEQNLFITTEGGWTDRGYIDYFFFE